MSAETPLNHVRRYGQVYPRAFAQAAELREVWRNRPDYKAWCYLPLSAAYAILEAESQRQGLPITQTLVDLGNLGAVLSWRLTQGVYRFDETVYSAIWNTPLDGDLPIDVLYRLPEWCVWIETPGARDLHSPGFFAYLEHDMNNGRPELRIAISDGQRLTTQIIHLTERTLADCIEASFHEGVRAATKAGRDMTGATEHGAVIADALKTIIAPRVSLLLYLCSVNGEIAGPGDKRPGNPAPKKTRHGARTFAASTPTAWDVGVRLGAAIRAAEKRERTESQGGTHASPRPHIRRAHWHTFLTGQGRQKRELKWIPPLAINAEGGEMPATVRDVG